MLEDFNDYFSLFTLVFMALASIRVLFGFLFINEDTKTGSKFRQFYHYRENEDE